MMDKPGRCGFNENVLCGKTKCHTCGWHPKVAEMRKEQRRQQYGQTMPAQKGEGNV